MSCPCLDLLLCKRWLRVGALEEELVTVDVPLRISTGSDEIKRKRQLTERKKYKSAQDVFSRISSDPTDLPDEKFQSALDNLENWWSHLRDGDVTMDVVSGDEDKHLMATQPKETKDDTFEEKVENQHVDPQSDSDKTAEVKQAIKPFNLRRRVGRPRKNRAAAEAHQRQE
ncbi:hypothetical protein PHYPSEUDO_015624 [Phytophthora pseudosyringae]|uniref:Uncharacterized protein n=1 Tax=Phytophthora pseudosyringae TaxID=221518 RepID=A0A8T1V327_9STRA|nr:hypothetical protein PHYPSEUDO_015624 [Phytophthora pseudosyringae]